jgi:transposase
MTFGPTTKIYLAVGGTDMRKSFDALSAVARQVLEKDPRSGHVFVFCSRQRNLLKILFWDGSGFWVLAKRLARGTFAWPKTRPVGGRSIEVRSDELAALLGGIDLRRSRWQRWWREGPPPGALAS